MTRVSVVVPVYNVEAYLPECIDSIRSQTLTDIEIICVNDGSRDRSGTILEAYARLDDRIRVLTIENQGVSHARNLGIEAATGDIVCFVDADDALLPRACERMVEAFDSHDVDVVKFSAEPFPACRSNPWIDGTLSLPDRVFERYSDELVFDVPSRPFPWNGAYRASFLRESGITFPEGVALGEDQVFSFSTLARARGVLLSSERLYRYRVARADSAMALAARDLAERVGKHLDVVSLVLDDWIAAGRMEGQSARRMLTFVLDFIMPNIIELDDDAGRDALLARFRAILRGRFTADEIGSWLRGDRILDWVLRVYDYDGDASTYRGRMYDYVAAMWGRRESLRRRAGDMGRRLIGPLRRWRRGHLGPSADEFAGSMAAERSIADEGRRAAVARELLALELLAREPGARAASPSPR